MSVINDMFDDWMFQQALNESDEYIEDDFYRKFEEESIGDKMDNL